MKPLKKQSSVQQKNIKNLEENLMNKISDAFEPNNESDKPNNKQISGQQYLGKDIDLDEINEEELEKALKEYNILHKAKDLIEKSKQQMNDPAQQNLKSKKKGSKKKKDNGTTFLTGINIFGEIQKREDPILEEEKQEEMVTDQEIIQNLKSDYGNYDDDLAELKRMLKETKKNVRSFGVDVNSLKSQVTDLNTEFNSIGIGVNNNIFYDVDRYIQASDRFSIPKNSDYADKTQKLIYKQRSILPSQQTQTTNIQSGLPRIIKSATQKVKPAKLNTKENNQIQNQ